MFRYNLRISINQIPLSRCLLRSQPLLQKSITRSIITSTVDWKPLKSTNTPKEGEEKKKGSFGKKIILGLMIAMPVISFYLGTWQLRRLEWKSKLIASCESRLTYAPTPLPKHFPMDMCENWEYRRVIIRGHFVHEEEMFVGPRVKNGRKGYLLFTPFVREDTGEKLLIERGWVGDDKVLPQSRTLHHLSIPQGSIDLVCLVRVTQTRTRFQWDKEDKNSRLWQVPDVFSMAKYCGSSPIHLQALYSLKDNYTEDKLENTTSAKRTSRSAWKFWQSNELVENKRPPQSTKTISLTSTKKTDESVEFSEWQFVRAGVPIGKPLKIDLKNNHLQYLVTWYGLSFLSSIFLVVALMKFRGGSAGSQAKMQKDKLRHSQKYM